MSRIDTTQEQGESLGKHFFFQQSANHSAKCLVHVGFTHTSYGIAAASVRKLQSDIACNQLGVRSPVRVSAVAEHLTKTTSSSVKVHDMVPLDARCRHYPTTKASSSCTCYRFLIVGKMKNGGYYLYCYAIRMQAKTTWSPTSSDEN